MQFEELVRNLNELDFLSPQAVGACGARRGTMTVFFDTEGRAWITCKADHAKAEAFGPSGVARPIDDMEAYDLGLRTDPRSTVTHFAAADAQRRVVRATAAHEWDWLPDGEPLLRLEERNRPRREWGLVKPHYTPGS